jgi:hypothetical protein
VVNGQEITWGQRFSRDSPQSFANRQVPPVIAQNNSPPGSRRSIHNHKNVTPTGRANQAFDSAARIWRSEKIIEFLFFALASDLITDKLAADEIDSQYKHYFPTHL